MDSIRTLKTAPNYKQNPANFENGLYLKILQIWQCVLHYSIWLTSFQNHKEASNTSTAGYCYPEDDCWVRMEKRPDPITLILQTESKVTQCKVRLILKYSSYLYQFAKQNILPSQQIWLKQAMKKDIFITNPCIGLINKCQSINL